MLKFLCNELSVTFAMNGMIISVIETEGEKPLLTALGKRKREKRKASRHFLFA